MDQSSCFGEQKQIPRRSLPKIIVTTESGFCYSCMAKKTRIAFENGSNVCWSCITDMDNSLILMWDFEELALKIELRLDW